MSARRPTSSVHRPVAIAGLLALITTSCMFGGGDDDQQVFSGGKIAAIESGMPEDPNPSRGGQIVYGLEAESAADLDDEGNVASGGYCLPEARLAISGIQVSRAIFDTLVVPDSSGGYAPYLARSVEPNDDHTVWTIRLREGVEFHNGEPVDAKAVKANLDAYRNHPSDDHDRASQLIMFVLGDVESVTATDELTVTVETTRPWVAFPAALYSSGRLGIVAPEQLKASATDCATRPIGSGPFKLAEGDRWAPGEDLVLVRNPDYWLIAPDDEPYPYVDAVTFRAVINSDERLAMLQQGNLNMLMTSSAAEIATSLTQLRNDGAINLLVSEERTETSYVIMNLASSSSDGFCATKASYRSERDLADLTDLDTRTAISQAIDRDEFNQISNRGLPALADGPFAPEVIGHVSDPGAPGFDPDAARATVQALKDAGKSTELELMTSSGPQTVRTSGILKEMLEDAGFTVNLKVVPENELIDEVVGGSYHISTFRNQPGEDPDANFNWWHSESPVNFGCFADEVIDENLETGRTNPDPDVRREAYETITRRFAEQSYNVYLNYSAWAVAESPNVHGILGPDLPDDQGPPPGRIVTGHPLHGVWIDPD